MIEQKYFKKDQVDKTKIVAVLADMLAYQNLHKHERKRMLEETLGKAYKQEGYKISTWDFEFISRKAEEYNLTYADMNLNQAKAFVIRNLKRVTGDDKAQNRDIIMALQILSNMAGLDAKFSGGFEENTGDQLEESLAEIEEDEKHDAEVLSTLNGDVPKG